MSDKRPPNADGGSAVGREDLRILWKQIAARHAFAYNPESMNLGTVDALIEFAQRLSAQSAIGTTYRQVGWAQIELRATQGGMLYEVAGSVSDERTEHHTEPVYIAVVEAADSCIDASHKETTK